ncbi:MAG: propionyl-CoA synthetase [Thermonemataceae bacterium]|nr:propionyl-CoA synthetase [Thermonemataceae bacterium]
MTYQEEYQASINASMQFWQRQAEQLFWFEKPKMILSQDSKSFYHWFYGGKMNTCYLALDYHVANGRAEQTALIYDSPATNSVKKYTYLQLLEEVSLFAGALQNMGLGKGDRAIIYMPMIPEAVIAMLACARLGVIHSVVFGGFAPHELAVRIDDALPKVIITASCGIEFSKIIAYKPLVDKAIEHSQHKPEKVIIKQRPEAKAELLPNRDISWESAIAEAKPTECEILDATDPLYILYTSGTTGKPKGIVRENGGHAVALKYSMKAIYDTDPGDVFWAASDVGWVVGHSYIVYAPLIQGCTTILYEGKPIRTPDAGAFWRVIEQHQVKSFFVAPTAFRAIKKEDYEAKLKAQYDISSLKNLFLAGERLDPPTYHWLKSILDIPVIDHWWQTETGWAIVGNLMGIEPKPTKIGSATLPMPGYDIRVLDDEGKEVDANTTGNIVIKLPLPPSCLPTLWNDDERFIKSYLSTFEGYYQTGDGGYKDEEGYIYIMGRVDDVINVAGHRLSTGEMEEIIASHQAVAECAVVGIADELKGQLPIGFVVLKDNITIDDDDLEKELVNLIRENIGAIACFHKALVVKRLPKTRSGKILRKTIRQIADEEKVSIPSTIDDPLIIDEIRELMMAKQIGIALQTEGL